MKTSTITMIMSTVNNVLDLDLRPIGRGQWLVQAGTVSIIVSKSEALQLFKARTQARLGG